MSSGNAIPTGSNRRPLRGPARGARSPGKKSRHARDPYWSPRSRSRSETIDSVTSSVWASRTDRSRPGDAGRPAVAANAAKITSHRARARPTAGHAVRPATRASRRGTTLRRVAKRKPTSRPKAGRGPQPPRPAKGPGRARNPANPRPAEPSGPGPLARAWTTTKRFSLLIVLVVAVGGGIALGVHQGSRSDDAGFDETTTDATT